MATEPARAGAAWLRLREAADAHARAVDLVDPVAPRLGSRRPLVVHDLGCGTGSMARWLAPRLSGPQHWVLVDRDQDLLDLVPLAPPPDAGDGTPSTYETLRGDVTLLGAHLEDASLVTASALLDMLGADELGRFVESCVAAGCPLLLTLSVTGGVDLAPAEPFDEQVRAAFNAHQRRVVDGRRLLGPDAVALAAGALRDHGLQVVVRESPWRLGPAERELAAAWLRGWVGAACEQAPELAAPARAYAARRRAQAASGALSVTVHHQDLLALPR